MTDRARMCSSGGFSDTYAALCDFNEMPLREEIQWDVDNIYGVNNWREFNLQDFSHLDSRNLALAVASLSFNQWFTKIYCKDLKLSVDIQQQLTFLLSRSPGLEELSLEAIVFNQLFLFKFLSSTNRLSHLDLSDTSCPLDTLRSAGAQVIQEHISDATAIRSLDISDNVCDSKLKTGIHILLSALGGHAALAEVDISGNNIGDQGAKMLAKALMTNTRLRNFTLQQMSGLADITQSYRSSPDRTKEALHKIQRCLDRNNQRQSERVKHVFRAQQSEKVQGMCQQLEDSLQRLKHCNIQDVQADILTAHEVLHNAKESLKLLPSLDEAGRKWASDGDVELATDLRRCAEAACPWLVQRSSVCECLSECVSKRSRQAQTFLRSTLVENTGQIISDKLRELRHTLSVSLAESIIEQVQQDLTMELDKMDCLIKENSCIALKTNIPELRLVDSNFPTDDYSPAFWRNSFHSKSLRPAPSIKRPSPSPSPSPPGLRGWRRREGEVVADAASLIPPPSLPLLYSVSARAAEEEAAGRGGLPRRQAPFPGCGPSPGPLPGSGSPDCPMDPLPTQGQTLRHYTASRPRPRRTHTQPPSSRPQEPVLKVENESGEGMGRVDEGVEEFFTKKIIPDYALKGQWEESIPAQATPPESSSTHSASTPFSSSSDNITSTTPTTTTVTSPSVPSTDTPFTSTDVSPLSTPSTPPAPSSITTSTLPTKNIKKKFGDFFAFKRARAGRATKAGGGEGGGGAEGVRVKRTSIADLIRPLREAKEREREREREKGRGARSVEDANVCNDAATTEGTVAIGRRLAGDAGGTMAPAKTLTTTTPSSDTAPPYPTITTSPDLATATLLNLEEGALPVLPGRSPSPVVTSPLTEQDRRGVPGKETTLGGTPYGERRLKVTKRSLREGKSQSLILLTGNMRLRAHLNKDEELRKANSEGAILDKPVPPSTYMKPRTMSTSAADPRHPMRALDPIRPDPPLYPKPAVPERPVVPLPPKPAVAAKPPLPTPARPASAPPPSSPAGRVQLRAHTFDGRPGESTAQNGSQECPQGAASAPSSRRELLPPAPSPWRGPELKAVLQRSPIRCRGKGGDLPTCTEDPSASDTGKQTCEGKKETVQMDERGRPGCGRTVAETKHPPPGEEDTPVSRCPSSTAQAQQEASAPRLFSPTAAVDRSVLERPPALTQTRERSPVTPTSEKKSPSTAPPVPRTLEKPLVSPPPQEKTPSTIPAAPESPEHPRVSPLSHKKKSPGAVAATADSRNSTQERGGALSAQHTMKAEPADQRTEPPLCE
ncbi:hypothetical protein FQN60_014626 [Etheostoma spectabile]|uniref:CARMIL C-terminal domain-containing protein n=1 Tax=Etheostoma spectabile TaxID=54343 RepID=A0A5J5D7G7_9PERO|nr:hypothetical protein FQN60_014626 [Etheostoma spectabile]